MRLFPRTKLAMLKVLFWAAVDRGDYVKAMNFWQEWKARRDNPKAYRGEAATPVVMP